MGPVGPRAWCSHRGDAPRQPQKAPAGVDGSRTHRGPQRDPPQVLKTRKPTGTLPLPHASIIEGIGLGKYAPTPSASRPRAQLPPPSRGLRRMRQRDAIRWISPFCPTSHSYRSLMTVFIAFPRVFIDMRMRTTDNETGGASSFPRRFERTRTKAQVGEYLVPWRETATIHLRPKLLGGLWA
jgi:hypothetical protein